MFQRPRQFLDMHVLSRLAAIPLFARRPMLGSVSGRHPSPHRGASVEFAEYRKYVPGDDLRRLDWRAYGRSDRFYVKEFEADTNLRCCFLVDTSGSMNFASAGTTRIDYARRLAGTLAYLAVQQGDAVGLACIADGIVRNIPPRRNPSHLKVVFDQLEQLSPAGPSRLIAALHELAETIRQRALIIILSDLFVDPAELKGCFEHLRFCKHDVAVFHLLADEELEFNFRKPIRFLDMEGGPPVFADCLAIAEKYHEAVRRYINEMKQIVLESGIDYHLVKLSDSYEQVLLRFLIGRAKGQSAV